MTTTPISATKIEVPHREIAYTVSLVMHGNPATHALMVPPAFPSPWRSNQQDTVYLANWHLSELKAGRFRTPADCLTRDPAVALSTGRALVHDGMTVVLSFEDGNDSWASWPLLEQERFRRELAILWPTLKVAAWVPQAMNLLDSKDIATAAARTREIREGTLNFDLIAAQMYYHPGDEGNGLMSSKQYRVLRAWEKSLAPGKKLIAVVNPFVEHQGYRICTPEQYGLQVNAARLVNSVVEINHWGDILNTFELKLFTDAALPLLRSVH